MPLSQPWDLDRQFLNNLPAYCIKEFPCTSAGCKMISGMGSCRKVDRASFRDSKRCSLCSQILKSRRFMMLMALVTCRRHSKSCSPSPFVSKTPRHTAYLAQIELGSDQTHTHANVDIERGNMNPEGEEEDGQKLTHNLGTTITTGGEQNRQPLCSCARHRRVCVSAEISIQHCKDNHQKASSCAARAFQPPASSSFTCHHQLKNPAPKRGRAQDSGRWRLCRQQLFSHPSPFVSGEAQHGCCSLENVMKDWKKCGVRPGCMVDSASSSHKTLLSKMVWPSSSTLGV